jgi:hypothetical protein
MIQLDRRLWTWIYVQSKQTCATPGMPEREIARMQCHLRHRSGTICQGGCAAKMIEMRMGQPDADNSPTALPDLLQNYIAIPSRVDDHRFPSF